MLKYFSKTFLISIISGSLLSFNPSLALAATDGATQTTTDSNGIITATKNYKFEKISDSDMLTSITMLAGGYITGRMLRVYRPPTMDVMIAAAGGAAYVAGEVMTNIKFKGKIDAMTVEVEKKNDGTVNEEQVQRLKDLKKSYEEAKKTVGYKKMLQLGSAAAFGAAGAAAAYMWFAEDASIATCRAAMSTAQTALKACMADSSLAASEASACGACAGDLTQYGMTYNSYAQIRGVPKLSVASDKAASTLETKLKLPICVATPGAQATAISKVAYETCSTTVTTLIANQTESHALGGAAPGASFNSVKDYLHLPTYTNIPDAQLTTGQLKLFSFLEKGLNLFFPKAEASWLPLLGLGASTAAAFLVITTGTAAELDLMMFVPRNRTIAWGLLAGLALMASKSSENVMKKLDANIAKIDAILADLDKLAKGVKAQNLTQQGITISTVNPAINSGVSFSTDSVATTECMTGNSSTNCPALANQLTSMPGFANLPDSFKDIASQSVALGDSLSGASGISGSTLSSADSLGSKQSAIAKLLKSRQDALNKTLNGKTTIQKDEDKLQKSMAARIKKALESKGMNATGFMASIGSTPIDSSASKGVADTSLLKKAGGTANAVNIQDGAGADKEAQQSLKLDFKEQNAGAGVSMGEVTASNAKKEYDIKTPEINGEFGPTLFELISGRYIKSGYPKLLEEEPTTK